MQEGQRGGHAVREKPVAGMRMDNEEGHAIRAMQKGNEEGMQSGESLWQACSEGDAVRLLHELTAMPSCHGRRQAALEPLAAPTAAEQLMPEPSAPLHPSSL
eukprot:305010-Pelagomonas_calceolata.AAC.2